MKKLLILMLILIIPMIMAEQSGGEVNLIQGSCGNLTQICTNCTYINLTHIKTTTGRFLFVGDVIMDRIGSTYFYMFCDTNNLYNGEYCMHGDVDGIDTPVCKDFKVTPSGKSGTDNLVFFIFVIIMLYAITFIGFFGKNIPITILGGMSMLGLGLYTINNGIIIYRDWLTNYFSYVTLAIGGVLAFWAIFEWLQDTLG